MSMTQPSDRWWPNAIVYCLDPETFSDADGDGVGDFVGLTERIDHLAGLGVTCVWLMPFYPSPNHDDGYDVTDYYAVEPTLGTLGDFVRFVRTAKDRGMRVIVDLVVNHTSDRHPWFREARRSRSSRYRDYYVWRDEIPEGLDVPVVFPDAEDSVWTWDEEAGQYYLHHFYSHQPDLNYANPAVRDEIAKIAGFWLELGVDGFRVDAVPFLIEDDEIAGRVGLDPHEFLRDFSGFVSGRRGDAVLLGEVNLPPRQLRRYLGRDGDELQLLFNFPVMQAMYLAFARADASPLAEAIGAVEVVEGGGYANFVRNHDELTLDQLSPDERAEVFAAFGPDPDMQLFGRGLRRRLPPMVDGDPRRIRLAYSLLFSLPGTPVLFYGEEIGMGENLAIEGRRSVRTPMQWSDARNGGFSTAPPSALRRPVVTGAYGPDHVNVAAQRRDPGSLLRWMEHVIRRRRETPAFGRGPGRVLSCDRPAVLAHRCEGDRGPVVAVHHLADDAEMVRIELGDVPARASAIDLLDDEAEPVPIEGSTLELKIGPYGYRWFRVAAGASADAQDRV